MDTGVLPSSWLTAYVTPISKIGSTRLPENYRPVSLACVPCKLIEHVIYSHIGDHLYRNGTLSTFHHGFKAMSSCETQLAMIIQDIINIRDHGTLSDIAIQKVIIDGQFSTDSDVTSEVPQGTVMRPLLFLLYINDLPSVLQPSTKCHLFADDYLTYCEFHSPEDQFILQEALDTLAQRLIQSCMLFIMLRSVTFWQSPGQETLCTNSTR